MSQALQPLENEEKINEEQPVLSKNGSHIPSKNESVQIHENIEELEHIVNKLTDTNSELPESIPNEGKTPKSKRKE